MPKKTNTKYYTQCWTPSITDTYNMQDSKHPFQVPDGYFEQLEKDILAKTTLSHKNIFGTQDNHTPIASPFTVPKEYFEQSAQNILAKTSQQLPKNTPFKTPDAYFETLPQQITKKIKLQNTNIFWSFFQKTIFIFEMYFPLFFPKKQLFYSFIIINLGIIMFYSFSLEKNNNNTLASHNILNEKKIQKNNEDKIQKPKNNTKKTLNLDTQNLSNNVVNKNVYNESSINKVLEQNTKSLDEQLQFISKEDLEEYLKNEEMNHHDILEIITEEQSAMMLETIILGKEEHEEELRHKKEQEINQLLHEIHELAEQEGL